MKKVFSYDSGLVAALNVLADVMFVNILYVVLCIPVITMGAARTALYTVALRWSRRESAGIGAFLTAFRENFRGTLGHWAAMLCGGLLLATDIALTVRFQLPGEGFLRVALVLLTGVWALTLSQLFMVDARFNGSFREALKNALLIALAHPLNALLHLALAALPFVLFFLAPEAFVSLGLLWFLGYFSLEGLLDVCLSRRIYQRLISRSREA